MRAALQLVPDVGAGDDDGGLSPLEQWELTMRGAGRSNRTISEMIGLMHRLERFSGSRVTRRPANAASWIMTRVRRFILTARRLRSCSSVIGPRHTLRRLGPRQFRRSVGAAVLAPGIGAAT